MWWIEQRAVSIILNKSPGPSRVTTHDFNDDDPRPQTLPDAAGYSFLNKKAPSSGIFRALDEQISKRISKSIRSLGKLYGVIQEDNGHAVAHPFYNTTEEPGVTVTRSAFISCPPTCSSQKLSEMTEIYAGARFQYCNGFSSIQHFETRCSALRNALVDKTSSGVFTIVAINIGMCMFSKSALIGVSDDGEGSCLNKNLKGIPQLPEYIEPTMYELETIARLSSAVADTIYLVTGRSKNPDATITVNIDIPDFQYYRTACELFEKGQVGAEYVQNWITAMDCRKHQLGAVLMEMIRLSMEDRGISSPGVTIRLSSGTEEAASLFKNKVMLGRTPNLTEVLDVMASRGFEAKEWQEFLGSLDARQQPFNMDQLGKLVYVFKTVKSVLLPSALPGLTSDAANSINETLLIQINDIREWRIFDRAKRFLHNYSKTRLQPFTPAIVGLFPMQKIFLHGGGRSDLYQENSSGLYLDINMDGRAQEVTIGRLDIVGKTYGFQIASRLRDLCLSQGLLK
ncbi:hypothetical protein VFPPC_14988 [Pochonia chlamydosporia 170]|uniref:Uncharacterized protein n=1 Tax=Pochonia chlamydosporia 170 TaxID=1380566 RepID=A0A179F0R4_METCM|nr:hypothetical protein VFPPC_14988 [Pochonia chlamydosporia 170]OAQ59057.1 hypothetical protein VFPPC_14988 [Pochonia chlamydosporia 170]